MKVGDRVWATVTRDRERIGGIIEIDEDEPKYRIQLDNMEKGLAHLYNTKDVRLVSDPQIATKHDQEKNRLELIPVSGIEGIGRAMTYGAKKYSDNNWANGFSWLRLCGSALRHLMAFISGQDVDPESGLSNLDHLGACVVMLIAHKEEGLGVDDRRKVKDATN